MTREDQLTDALTSDAVARDHDARTDAQIALFAQQAPDAYIATLRNADPTSRKRLIAARQRGEAYLERNGWNR